MDRLERWGNLEKKTKSRDKKFGLIQLWGGATENEKNVLGNRCGALAVFG